MIVELSFFRIAMGAILPAPIAYFIGVLLAALEGREPSDAVNYGRLLIAIYMAIGIQSIVCSLLLELFADKMTWRRTSPVIYFFVGGLLGSVSGWSVYALLDLLPLRTIVLGGVVGLVVASLLFGHIYACHRNRR